MIVHNKFHIFIFGVIILLCMVIPVSAISPAPKEVYTSVSVSYTNFLAPSSGNSNTGYVFDSSGNRIQYPNAAYRGYIFCHNSYQPLNYFNYSTKTISSYCINSSTGEPILRHITSIVFYDSNYTIISVTHYDALASGVYYFSDIPSNAVYYRFSSYYPSTTISPGSYKSALFPNIVTSSTANFYFEEFKPSSVDGDYVIFPVTTEQFNAFYIDVEMFDEAVDTTDISFTMSVDIAPIVNPTSYESLALSSTSNLPVFRAYHFENGEKVYSSKLFVYELSQDGLSFTLEADLNEPFSGFEVQYVLDQLSYASGGYFRAKFQDFTLNYDEEYELKYILQEMDNLTDNKQEQVSAVISDLTLPTPNIDGAFSGLDDLSTAYHNSETELVATFHILYDSFPIIVLFMTLSISMTVLGYILFGKSG